MPSDQTTRIPAVPVRTAMFEGRDDPLTRTWIIFFERLAGLRAGLASDADVINTIAFGINGSLGVGTITRLLEITPGAAKLNPDNYVFRCRAAYINAETAPTGAAIKVDFRYSSDDYDVPLASRSWNNIFATANGELDLPAGLIQRETPLEVFSGDPTPLDLPHRSIVQMRVMQVGSTIAGANIGAEIMGEIRHVDP